MCSSRKNDIALGQTITPELMQWQTWTETSSSNNFIKRKDRPNAVTDLAGSIVRAPFIAGEPIREQKLGESQRIRLHGRHSAEWACARVSTEISPETGAGGFILPNDRVDVVLSKHEKIQASPDSPQTDFVSSQAVLSNIRVLAIDQAPKEKEGPERRARQGRLRSS